MIQNIPLEEKKGDVVKQIELYKLTRCRSEDGFEEGSWVSEGAKKNYCKMMELRDERLDEGDTLDEEHICEEVLGFKSGYIRGRGAGPKPSRSMSYRNYGLELEEATKNAKSTHERAEKDEEQVMVFFEQLKKQDSVIQELKEGLTATQKAMVVIQKSQADMMSVFGQFHRANQFSAISTWFSTPQNHVEHRMQGFTHGYASQKVQNLNTESDDDDRGVKTFHADKYRKGACENRGAMTHDKKACVERPRQLGAKWTSKNIAADEKIETFDLDYDGKRDR
ncbi:hypothetical protein RD792_005485 [Penstemon davidsonii]|uniref:Pre-mRNA-splicing factor SLU7 n=1 Tax=Penstemon davidsonii TaxID=160366 RepID=A0ABR0DKD7_9LAMI|nr:hypothetical protein RD792_005485 [Penstemon davidsonii]